jgi:hypothetical protein
LGTTDNVAFRMRIIEFFNGIQIRAQGLIDPVTRSVFFGLKPVAFNGTNTVGMGHFALLNLALGNGIVAIGDSALRSLGNSPATLYHNNTAIGYYAAASSNNVENTTAFGSLALINNSASANTAVGAYAMRTMPQPRNTAFGSRALQDVSSPDPLGAWLTDNTAFGTGSMGLIFRSRGNASFGDNTFGLFRGSFNSAFGYLAINGGNDFIDVPMDSSAGIGFQALASGRSGAKNTAIGATALSLLIDEGNNTAIGFEALGKARSHYNSAAGAAALANLTAGEGNTAVGSASSVGLTTASNTTSLGYLAFAVGNASNATAIGASSFPSNNNHIRVGNASVSSIGGEVAWTTISNGTIKTEIKEDIPGLAFIKMLKPVTYQFDPGAMQEYDKGLSPALALNSSIFSERHAGLIAQEVLNVAKVYAKHGLTDLVSQPDTKDGLHAINYELMVVPLVKTIQQQQATIKQIETVIAQLEAQLKK